MTYWLLNASIVLTLGVILPFTFNVWLRGGLRQALRPRCEEIAKAEGLPVEVVEEAIYSVRWSYIPPAFAKATLVLTLLGCGVEWLVDGGHGYVFGVLISWTSWVRRWLDEAPMVDEEEA